MKDSQNIGTAARRFVRAVVGELRWRLATSVLVAIALAITEGTGLLLLVPLLASIGLDVQTGLTSGFADRVSRAFAGVGLQPNLLTVLAVFLAVAVAQAVLYRAYLVLNPSLEQQFVVALRRRLYAAIVGVNWSFFITRRTNDLLHAVTTDVDRAGGAAYRLLTLFTGVVVTAMYVLVAFRLSPALTSSVAATGLAVLWASRRRTKHSAAMGERYADVNRQQFNMISESIAGLKVAKSFGAERRDIQLFAGHARARSTAYMDLLRSFARAKLGLDVTSALLISGLLFAAVQFFGVRGAGLLMLIFVFSRIMPRVMSLQESAQIVISGVPSFAAVMRLVDECEAHAERLPETTDRLPLRREVRFEGVSYRYASAATPAVDRISLPIPAGSTVAIVGASGAGKSTVADLLIGLLQPSAGRITIDGLALTDAELAAWRASIGYVPQDSFLLHDTVRANLLWARPDVTDDEMWSALERAAAADFLRSGRDGLDTVVGDRGVRLSGGERQRLALARALLCRPGLLVLDEATSALDSVNEAQILETVRDLGHTVTTVIVTHRLTAIRDADFIHVMDRGRVVESGTWNDLVALSGAFTQLLAAQGLERHRTRTLESAPSKPAAVS